MVRDSKKETVKEFVTLIDQFPIIGVVDMEGLPTPQVQNMRASLRSQGIVLKMTKKRMLKIILEQAEKKKEGIKELVPKLRGMPAIICTKSNPFKLFKLLKASKSKAPARAGQTAPNDIVVPAGPTGFAPGPIIGELGSVGIKAGIDGGKVAVKEDSTVVKEGEVISAKLAGILTRLGIEPMEIGLNLTGVYEDGTVFTKDILDIDEQEYINNITLAHQWAFNLAIDSSYVNADTRDTLIGKAFNDAKALAIETAFLSKDTITDLLAKAQQQANALDQTTNN